jgi:hypothetical protein
MAGLSLDNLPVKIRKIALRGNLGRAGRCRADALVSGPPWQLRCWWAGSRLRWPAAFRVAESQALDTSGGT